ncbi:MAG: hypothetical protein NC120_12340 [Ruminococcus sp.]|nr:hypothetical protein [Ruminococcus sp.]
MFKYPMIIPKNEEEIDLICQIASMHHIYTWYKIGVYGKIRKNEIYLDGSFWNRCRFIKDIKERGLIEET